MRSASAARPGSAHLKDGEVHSYQITPEEYGFQRAAIDAIKGGDAQENARIIRNILDGQEGARKDMVLLNAAAAFVAAGLDQDLKDPASSVPGK